MKLHVTIKKIFYKNLQFYFSKKNLKSLKKFSSNASETLYNEYI